MMLGLACDHNKCVHDCRPPLEYLRPLPSMGRLLRVRTNEIWLHFIAATHGLVGAGRGAVTRHLTGPRRPQPRAAAAARRAAVAAVDAANIPPGPSPVAPRPQRGQSLFAAAAARLLGRRAAAAAAAEAAAVATGPSAATLRVQRGQLEAMLRANVAALAALDATVPALRAQVGSAGQHPPRVYVVLLLGHAVLARVAARLTATLGAR